MIYMVNPSLINVETKECENDRGKYYQTTFYSIDSEPRILASCRHDSEDLNKSNTSISLRQSGHTNSIFLTQFASKKDDRDEDIVIMAVPFIGIVKQMDTSSDYRIYKGFISKAQKGERFEWNGKYYSRIAYLVIHLNTRIFSPDHKLHKDTLSFVMDTYYLGKDGKQTTHRTYTENWSLKDNELCNSCTDTSEDCEPVDPSEVSAAITFPIYQKPEHVDRPQRTDRKPRYGNNDRENNGGHFKSSNRGNGDRRSNDRRDSGGRPQKSRNNNRKSDSSAKFYKERPSRIDSYTKKGPRPSHSIHDNDDRDDENNVTVFSTDWNKTPVGTNMGDLISNAMKKKDKSTK